VACGPPAATSQDFELMDLFDALFGARLIAGDFIFRQLNQVGNRRVGQELRMLR
jgi:hypothetical protein